MAVPQWFPFASLQKQSPNKPQTLLWCVRCSWESLALFVLAIFGRRGGRGGLARRWHSGAVFIRLPSCPNGGFNGINTRTYPMRTFQVSSVPSISVRLGLIGCYLRLERFRCHSHLIVLFHSLSWFAQAISQTKASLFDNIQRDVTTNKDHFLRQSRIEWWKAGILPPRFLGIGANGDCYHSNALFQTIWECKCLSLICVMWGLCQIQFKFFVYWDWKDDRKALRAWNCLGKDADGVFYNTECALTNDKVFGRSLLYVRDEMSLLQGDWDPCGLSIKPRNEPIVELYSRYLV